MITDEFRKALDSSAPEAMIRAILTWSDYEPSRAEMTEIDRRERQRARRVHYQQIKEPVLRNLEASRLQIDNRLENMPKAVVSGPASAWSQALSENGSPLNRSDLQVNADFAVSTSHRFG